MNLLVVLVVQEVHHFLVFLEHQLLHATLSIREYPVVPVILADPAILSRPDLRPDLGFPELRSLLGFHSLPSVHPYLQFVHWIKRSQRFRIFPIYPAVLEVQAVLAVRFVQLLQCFLSVPGNQSLLVVPHYRPDPEKVRRHNLNKFNLLPEEHRLHFVQVVRAFRSVQSFPVPL